MFREIEKYSKRSEWLVYDYIKFDKLHKKINNLELTAVLICVSEGK